MTIQHMQGLVSIRHLTAKVRSETAALAAVCKQHEPGLTLPLYLESPRPALGETDHFGYYDDGALVGLANLSPGSQVEVQMMVHPALRRRGIGRVLLNAVGQECQQRRASSFILVCEGAAPSGQAFATAVGATYRFAEHRLQLDRAAYADHPLPRSALEVEPANMQDLEVLVALWTDSKDISEEEARRAMTRWIEQADKPLYAGRLAGELVAMLRLYRDKPDVFIQSLRVHPAHRGHGYGRQILTEVLDRLIAEPGDRIMIEVETENEVATSLYRSCGFRKVATFLYYECPAAAPEPDARDR